MSLKVARARRFRQYCERQTTRAMHAIEAKRDEMYREFHRETSAFLALMSARTIKLWNGWRLGVFKNPYEERKP